MKKRPAPWAAVLAGSLALLLLGGAAYYLLGPSSRAPTIEAFRALPPDFGLAWQIDWASLRSSPLVRELFRNARLVPRELEPEYSEFERQTGFDYRRQPDLVSGVLTSSRGRELSVVADGRFDPARLIHYLDSRKLGNSPHGGYQVFRFSRYQMALVDSGRLVIVSSSDEKNINGILDRLASGSDSAAKRLAGMGEQQRIPKGSQIWVVIDPRAPGIDLPISIGPIGGTTVEFPSDLLGAGRFVVLSAKAAALSLEVQGEALYANDADARRLESSLRGFLGLIRNLAAARSSRGSNQALVLFLDSLAVQTEGNRLLVKARLDATALAHLLLTQPWNGSR